MSPRAVGQHPVGRSWCAWSRPAVAALALAAGHAHAHITSITDAEPAARAETGLLLARVRDLNELHELAAERGLVGASADRWARDARERAMAELAPLTARSWRHASDRVTLRLRVPGGLDAESLAETVGAYDAIAWAEREPLLLPSTISPDDPAYAQQWHHGAEHLDSERAWAISTGDLSIIVAVCDTGIDIDHPDLLNRLPGFNAVTRTPEAEGGIVTDPNGHGSRTAGSALATGNNAFGVAGVAWDAVLLPVKVSDLPFGGALAGDIFAGARWAVDQGARVVNVSFSGPTTEGVAELGAELRDRGALLVWSAGNEGEASVDQVAPGVIVVGAHDITGARWSGSNTGPGLDLMAPGVGVVTTTSTGGTAPATGTSFAAPIVSGAAALVWSVDPTLPAGAVEAILYATATDDGAAGLDDTTGHGRLNLAAAVEAAATGDLRLPLPLVDAFAIPPISGALVADGVRWDVDGASLARRGVDDGALRIPAQAGVTSAVVRGDKLAGEILSLRADVRGPGGAGALLVEWEDVDGVWQELARWPAHAPIDNGFARREAQLPEAAAHGQLRVRLTPIDADPWGVWFVDDLRLGRFDGLLLDPRDEAWAEDFEGGATVPGWATADGASDASASTSGNLAHRLDDGGTLETGPLLLQSFFGRPIEVSANVRSVDGAGRLVFEERNFVGQWVERASVDGSAASADAFGEARFEMSAFSVNNLSRVRVRALGGSFLIDDVRVGVRRARVCAADLDDSGTLGMPDVLLYLDLWSAGDPSADLDGDGAPGVFDVLAYLAIFEQGCPQAP